VGRQLRADFGTGFVHAYARGNNRSVVYMDEFDYVAWLRLLGIVVTRFGWRCHAYCLMPNHYHLLLETTQERLSPGMHRLNGAFAQRMNKRYERTGHAFEGPYRIELVENDGHLLELCRYIPLNAVRARLCEKVDEWKWSSYRATAGLEHAPPYLTTSLVRSLFGKGPTACTVYREFVAAGALAMSRDLVQGHAGSGP
jgi:REP-associated tyrosine transposase